MRAGEVINQASSALAVGEDFGDVARRLSRGIKAATGGVWPLMEAGSFREKEVEKAAFAMAEGQVSDVIETESGYYIAKVQQVRPGKMAGFEEAQEEIEVKLRNQEFRKLEQDYLQRLSASAHIRQSDEFLDMAVERATSMYWRP